MSVVNYYIVDGQSSPYFSLLRSKAGAGLVSYMLQVQNAINTSNAGYDWSRVRLLEFGGLCADPIRDLMPGTATQPVDASASMPTGGPPS